jgi:hypothetical protein
MPPAKPPAVTSEFVVCLSNVGYRDVLQVRKIYPIVEDPKAKRLGLVHIIDETGEAWLYPRSNFGDIIVPDATLKALLKRKRLPELTGEKSSEPPKVARPK